MEAYDTIKKNKMKRPSPMYQFRISLARGLSSLFLGGPPAEGLSLDGIEEVSASAFQTRGSMTVEAALVVPLFLFFFLNLMSAIEMIRLHGNLQAALWETGRELAVYGYAYDKGLGGEREEQAILDLGGTLLTDFAVYGKLVRDVGTNYLEQSPLSNGAKSLQLLESSYLGEGDCIDLKLTYSVSPWVKVVGFAPFRMSNRYYAKAWTGYDLQGSEESQEEGEDYVYMTEHGKVYHETPDCSYLRRTVLAVEEESIGFKKNESGKHYTPCERCAGQRPEEGMVYITPDGERYHSSRQCSSLNRNIRTVPRKEVEGRYPPCSRCGKKGG